MLRAYLRPLSALSFHLKEIFDHPGFQTSTTYGDKTVLRADAGGIIREIAHENRSSAHEQDACQGNRPKAGWYGLRHTRQPAHAGAVFDVRRRTTAELNEDFQRRVSEREFPTCPAVEARRRTALTFKNPTLPGASLSSRRRCSADALDQSSIFRSVKLFGAMRSADRCGWRGSAPRFRLDVEIEQVWAKKKAARLFFPTPTIGTSAPADATHRISRPCAPRSISPTGQHEADIAPASA